MKKSLIVKVAAGLGALALFGFLFARSLDDARSTPYTIERQHVRGGTLALEPASSARDPLLVRRSAPGLASGLFRQVFSRAMESLNAPVDGAVPLVLRGEFEQFVGEQLTPEALLAAAQAAGLESASFTPICLVHRRVSEPGRTRQVYFLAFDAPEVRRFRRQLGLDAAALTPILFIAGSGPDFNSWLPQAVDVEADCLAPAEVVG